MSTQPIDILIDANAQNISRSLASQFGGVLPEFILGDQRVVRIIIVGADGAPTAISGDATASLAVALGEVGSTPTSGTFTVTYGANTTPALAYNITATALQAALNTLASITAAGGVVVTGQTSGFRVVFNTNGARTDITGDGTELNPSSAVFNMTIEAGDGSTQSVQFLRIRQTVIAFQDTWTQYLDPIDGVTSIGWEGEIDTNTIEAALWLGNSASKQTSFEVQLTDSSGNVTTLMQQAVTFRNDIIDPSTLQNVLLPSFLTAAQAAALYVPLTQKGANNGVAELDAGGKVPATQIPTGVGVGDMLGANNLSELTNTATARTNLGLGTMATETATNYLSKAGNLAGLANPFTSISNLGLRGAWRRTDSIFEIVVGADWNGTNYTATQSEAFRFVIAPQVGVIRVETRTGLTPPETFAIFNSETLFSFSNTGLDLLNRQILNCTGISFTGTGAADTRANLGLVIGSQVQAYSARLQAIPLSNYNATAAPAVSNDDTQGYSVGSNWYDVTNDDAYVCLDNTSGAAVWKKTTP
jgi:hypothetical protein